VDRRAKIELQPPITACKLKLAWRQWSVRKSAGNSPGVVLIPWLRPLQRPDIATPYLPIGPPPAAERLRGPRPVSYPAWAVKFFQFPLPPSNDVKAACGFPARHAKRQFMRRTRTHGRESARRACPRPWVAVSPSAVPRRNMPQPSKGQWERIAPGNRSSVDAPSLLYGRSDRPPALYEGSRNAGHGFLPPC